MNIRKFIANQWFIFFAWIAMFVSIFFTTFSISLDWNFFSWNPKYDFKAFLHISVIVICLIITSIIAQQRHNLANLFLSLIGCLVFSYIASYLLPPEQQTEGWLGRHDVSPTWFRASSCIIFLLPLLFWLAWPVGSLVKNLKKGIQQGAPAEPPTAAR